MKIAYFDCFSGISGDMTLGALIGAGADAEGLRRGLAGLGVAGFRIEVCRRMAGPISATDVAVILDEDHHHPTGGSGDILRIIEGADLSERVKQTPPGSSGASPRPRERSTATRPTRSIFTKSGPSMRSSTSSGRPCAWICSVGRGSS
jgi:hypothetical protein